MILTFLVLLLLSNGLTVRPDTSILYSRIGILIVTYGIISSFINFYINYLERGISLHGGLFNMTSVIITFIIFILLISGLILFLTAFYPRKKYIKSPYAILVTIYKKVQEHNSINNKSSEQFTIIEYALIIIFVISGATLLLSSADLGSIYLSIELQSFSLYIISSMHRNSESSTGSALIYFLLGGLSSCFILLGIALIYANSGLTNLDSVYSIVSDSDKYVLYSSWYSHNYIFYSLLLISVGFLFKIAAAPFHWWSPDVYDGVPTVVTTFIAILGKIAILILLLELVHYTSSLLHSTTEFYSWTTGLSLSCLMSLVIGTILGLTQTRIKRLLAYSTISHIGFILMALVVHSIESYQAFIFYIIQYILTNFNVFFILIAIGYSLYFYYSDVSEYENLPEKNNSPIQLIDQLKGYLSINPILALCLVITMFSFVGLPPLVGFFAKQMVLTSALDNNRIILVLIAVFTSVVGAVYYLTVIKTAYFYQTNYIKPQNYVKISLSNSLSVNLGIFNALIIIFMLTPNEILNLSDLLSIISFSQDGVYLYEGNAFSIFFEDNTNSIKDISFNGIVYVLCLTVFIISLFIMYKPKILKTMFNIQKVSIKLFMSIPYENKMLIFTLLICSPVLFINNTLADIKCLIPLIYLIGYLFVRFCNVKKNNFFYKFFSEKKVANAFLYLVVFVIFTVPSCIIFVFINIVTLIIFKEITIEKVLLNCAIVILSYSGFNPMYFYLIIVDIFQDIGILIWFYHVMSNISYFNNPDLPAYESSIPFEDRTNFRFLRDAHFSRATTFEANSRHLRRAGDIVSILLPADRSAILDSALKKLEDVPDRKVEKIDVLTYLETAVIRYELAGIQFAHRRLPGDFGILSHTRPIAISNNGNSPFTITASTSQGSSLHNAIRDARNHPRALGQ